MIFRALIFICACVALCGCGAEKLQLVVLQIRSSDEVTLRGIIDRDIKAFVGDNIGMKVLGFDGDGDFLREITWHEAPAGLLRIVIAKRDENLSEDDSLALRIYWNDGGSSGVACAKFIALTNLILRSLEGGGVTIQYRQLKNLDIANGGVEPNDL